MNWPEVCPVNYTRQLVFVYPVLETRLQDPVLSKFRTFQNVATGLSCLLLLYRSVLCLPLREGYAWWLISRKLYAILNCLLFTLTDVIN